MGTYTTNLDLYKPSLGEQGWGTLVNGNFTTIDTTMKGLNTRIGTLETEAETFDSRITAVENGEFNTNADIVCNSMTTDVLYLPLLTSGTAKVFSIPALSVSYSDTTQGWEEHTSFTVPTSYLRPANAVFEITCNYSWNSAYSEMAGGMRCYEDDAMIYELIGSRDYHGNEINQSGSFTFTAKYGSTYRFDFYANYSNSSYPVYQRLSTNGFNYYLY